MIIRKYEEKDLQQMIDIWNEVVEDGIAFPQEDFLDPVSGKGMDHPRDRRHDAVHLWENADR